MNAFRRFRIGTGKKRLRSGFIKGLTVAEYYKLRYHDPSTYRKCYICGRKKPVRMRIGKKGAVCPICYQKYYYTPPKSICYKCRQLRPVTKYTDDGKPICHNCCNKKIGFCSECREEKRIQALGLCYGCYQRRRRRRMEKLT